jgi:hypothetical protein
MLIYFVLMILLMLCCPGGCFDLLVFISHVFSSHVRNVFDDYCNQGFDVTHLIGYVSFVLSCVQFSTIIALLLISNYVAML